MAAIANAIYIATGVLLTNYPLSLENVLQASNEAGKA